MQVLYIIPHTVTCLSTRQPTLAKTAANLAYLIVLDERERACRSRNVMSASFSTTWRMSISRRAKRVRMARTWSESAERAYSGCLLARRE